MTFFNLDLFESFRISAAVRYLLNFSYGWRLGVNFSISIWKESEIFLEIQVFAHLDTWTKNMKSWSISCEHRHSPLECSHSESHCGLFPSKGSEEVGSSLINHDTWASWKLLGMTTDDPTMRRQVPICSSTYASGSEQIPSMLRLVLADLAADYLFHVQGLESSSGFKSYSQGTWL